MKSKIKRKNPKSLLALFLGVFSAIFTATAQTNPPFDLSHSVIASGGGSNSTGSSGGQTFRVDGTVGQNLAGSISTGSNGQGGQFVMHGGFWVPGSFGPTAARVSISGRVTALNGRPVSRAFVQILDASGVQRSVFTNVFGRFRFEGIEAGQTYIVDVRHRTLRFAPLIVSANDSVSDLEIIELP